MNSVSMVGRLTRDPELKEIGGGRQVCQMRVAVDTSGRVNGRLVFREWTAKDGTKRSEHSVRGRVEFLGSKVGEGSHRAKSEEVAMAL